MTTDISHVPIELWEVDRVKPYPFNNKKHPEKHIQTLMRSIKAQGHLEPLVLDGEGIIISGHGRFEALKRLGRDKVAVRVLKDITEPQAAALRIAANKTVSNEYDTDALSRELSRLSEIEIDLGALGFEDKELEMLVVDVGEIDEATLVIDMDEAVDAHEADVAERSEKADTEEVRLDKVFGFKTVPLRDQKHLSRFLAEVERFTGQLGAEALVTFARGWTPEAA